MEIFSLMNTVDCHAVLFRVFRVVDTEYLLSLSKLHLLARPRVFNSEKMTSRGKKRLFIHLKAYQRIFPA